MIVRIYKTTRNHRQLQRLIEEPEVIRVNRGEDKKVIARIPYKKHILAEEGECLPPNLAQAERKTVSNGNVPICCSTS